MVGLQSELAITQDVLKLTKGYYDSVAFLLHSCPLLFTLRERFTHKAYSSLLTIYLLIKVGPNAVITGIRLEEDRRLLVKEVEHC